MRRISSFLRVLMSGASAASVPGTPPGRPGHRRAGAGSPGAWSPPGPGIAPPPADRWRAIPGSSSPPAPHESPYETVPSAPEGSRTEFWSVSASSFLLCKLPMRGAIRASGKRTCPNHLHAAVSCEFAKPQTGGK